MSLRLGELLEGLQVSGDYPPELEVRGVKHDSRQVEPGELFVAITGAQHDGRDFASQAVARGAVAVLASGSPPTPLAVPWLHAAEPRRVLPTLAARIYGRPDRELQVIGVTGTNGKTTTTWILQSILEAAGRPTGRIGTLGYVFRGFEQPAQRTTPEASDLYRMLREMRDAGAAAAVMEVSSHALDLGRVDEMQFAAAVFTNLTRDHLDYHSGMDAYFAAKRRLFELLAPAGVAVVNADDPWGRLLAESLPRVLTFGERGEVRPVASTLDAAGIRATVVTPRGSLELGSQLRGSFNLLNILAAVACAEALELAQEAIVDGVRRVPPVPGRLEPVGGGEPFPIFVDYAHTEDGLARALEAVRQMTGRKVAVVFGCGGDRDPGKRAPMGKVAGELADLVILTSDNPRSEDPLAILAAVEEGVKESGNASYRLIPDRRDAIRRALAVVGPEWTVLVAGKGSETGQEIGGEIRPFSDQEEITKALEERNGVGNAG